MEMTYEGRVFSTYRLIETGGIACQAEPHGETSGSSRGRGSEGKKYARTFPVVSAGRNESDRASRLESS